MFSFLGISSSDTNPPEREMSNLLLTGILIGIVLAHTRIFSYLLGILTGIILITKFAWVSSKVTNFEDWYCSDGGASGTNPLVKYFCS
jgi:hypothetical protein